MHSFQRSRSRIELNAMLLGEVRNNPRHHLNEMFGGKCITALPSIHPTTDSFVILEAERKMKQSQASFYEYIDGLGFHLTELDTPERRVLLSPRQTSPTR